jgi:urease accessory protein
MQNADGRLALDFDYDARSARTIVKVSEQRQPLKVVRAFELEAGGALVHVHNLSGGVVAGDRLSLRVDVAARARAQITSTGATRVYRSRSGTADAEFSVHLRVGEHALVEYLPDPLIPFAGSRYRQESVVDLENSAGLFWWEIVAPGRAARGEVFAYDSLRLGLELRAAGVPIAIDRSELDPIARPLRSPARLGPYRYFSSFYICRAGASETTWRELEKELLELGGRLESPVIIWGLSRLPAHGLVVRAMSHNSRDIAAGLVSFWSVAKRSLYGQDAVIPRKIY